MHCLILKLKFKLYRLANYSYYNINVSYIMNTVKCPGEFSIEYIIGIFSVCLPCAAVSQLWTQLIKKRTKGLVVLGGLFVGLGMLTLSTTADLVEFPSNHTLQVRLV